MNALEEVQGELFQVQHAEPVIKEVETLGFKVIDSRSEYDGNNFHPKGFYVHITLDELCLDKKQLALIESIRGFHWISVWSNRLEVLIWRQEND